ncbi:hypothetical protein HCX50_02465 [Microbacterium oxydans]|uniref:hypothetical protein n=1 Tax=Microbacterium sp. B19(2022) TaxID=2914045 RepID=UPI0014316F74|nr:hypothetical protein [Microbacterium sp. B19(2022)]NJI58288.1 hypothetical protein [Microbacterium sp. B19(2022)]
MDVIDDGTIVPNLIFGSVAFVSGVLILVFRRRVNAWVFRSQKVVLGERVARASAGRQRPWMMGVVGVFVALMGAFMAFGGVAALVQV